MCKTLCEALLRLTLNQRYFIFAFIEDGAYCVEDIKDLFSYGCTYGDNRSCCERCHAKYNLNKFHAEQKCLDETRSNLLFLDGKWPIVDIKEV